MQLHDWLLLVFYRVAPPLVWFVRLVNACACLLQCSLLWTNKIFEVTLHVGEFLDTHDSQIKRRGKF